MNLACLIQTINTEATILKLTRSQRVFCSSTWRSREILFHLTAVVFILEPLTYLKGLLLKKRKIQKKKEGTFTVFNYMYPECFDFFVIYSSAYNSPESFVYIYVSLSQFVSH